VREIPERLQTYRLVGFEVGSKKVEVKETRIRRQKNILRQTDSTMYELRCKPEDGRPETEEKKSGFPICFK